MSQTVRFTLNGAPASAEDDDSGRALLWALRADLAQTGTKYGCGRARCGACTVLLDDRAVYSCLTPLKRVAGRRVETIEGLADGERLHPLQEAFVELDALQCGFCTPGMILRAESLLRRNATPSREQIVRAMEPNLCRCGSYRRIVDAIQLAAKMRAAGGAR